MIRTAACLIALSCRLIAQEPKEPVATFGITVVIPSALEGRIYYLREHTKKLPNFAKMKHVGTIYAKSLNIPPQDFTLGFPGVTDRVEWFAIDYRGRFWVEDAGQYRFSLIADDGANLYIDGKMVVDNNGQHPPMERHGKVQLNQGVHDIRVSYFQGPRYHVALILKVAPPGEEFRLFNTDELKPPPAP